CCSWSCASSFLGENLCHSLTIRKKQSYPWFGIQVPPKKGGFHCRRGDQTKRSSLRCISPELAQGGTGGVSVSMSPSERKPDVTSL
ncbi:hypothetical protein, partial [Bradyrhizobium sp. CCBAU 21362]|uniref:hypothetical protein n=1 Tax=Bradyrhizobium sp. CCBAU 21362 TaxID=1325082 RepID=UPI0023056CDA